MTSVGLVSVIKCIVFRDLKLAFRRLSDVLTTLFFFVIVVVLFPLGVGPESSTLVTIAPGVVWVAALLSTMLALDRIFSIDYFDGTLEQLVLAPYPLSILIFSKIFAHWLVTGLPLVIVAPILGLLLGLEAESLKVLMLTLVVGTPSMILIGAIAAALTLGLRGSGVLLSLLVLPLYIPILIFGTGAVEAQMSGLAYEAHFSLLGAFLVLAVSFAPITTSWALKISLE